MATASRKEEEESLRSRSGGFFWLLVMSSAISRRCKRGNIFDGLEDDGWEYSDSVMVGALLGPGRGEEVVCEGRFKARSDGEWEFAGVTTRPVKDRDNLWTGGGTKEFEDFSNSPGDGETSARDME